jgi:hypothetical protein
MGKLETVKIKNGEEGFFTINKRDFNPSVHELFTAHEAPKNYRSLSELRRILQQVNDAEALDALEVEENERPEGPRKGGLAAIKARREDLEVVHGDESEESEPAEKEE